MSARIHLAAIVLRDARIWLLRPRPDAAWELPGGPLPPGNDDIDAEMDAMLEHLGLSAPAIEEDFLETLHFSDVEGPLIYNLYAPTEWTGDPQAQPGIGGGWFGLDELDAIDMDAQVRDAILAAFGLRERSDDDSRILAALGEFDPDSIAGTRSEDSDQAGGHDVLRTLSGGGPGAYEKLRQRYHALADDVVAALDATWANPVLDRRTRSLQTVAMLAALGRKETLKQHIHGALNHGASPEQIVETLRMAGVYAGLPAALEAWPVMESVFERRHIAVPGRRA